MACMCGDSQCPSCGEAQGTIECSECLEQARLLGLSGSREARLLAQLAERDRELASLRAKLGIRTQQRDDLLLWARCMMAIPDMTDEQLAELKANAQQVIDAERTAK